VGPRYQILAPYYEVAAYGPPPDPAQTPMMSYNPKALMPSNGQPMNPFQMQSLAWSWGPPGGQGVSSPQPNTPVNLRNTPTQVNALKVLTEAARGDAVIAAQAYHDAVVAIAAGPLGPEGIIGFVPGVFSGAFGFGFADLTEMSQAQIDALDALQIDITGTYAHVHVSQLSQAMTLSITLSPTQAAINAATPEITQNIEQAIEDALQAQADAELAAQQADITMNAEMNEGGEDE